MMTPREFPRSPSLSVTPRRRPLRKARTCATAALLRWLTLAGRTDACFVYVSNTYNISLTLKSYNGWDGSCLAPYYTYTVDPNGDIEVDCSSEFAVTACKVKLADSNNNCYGTVLVGCGNTLRFFINDEGQYDYCNHMNCKPDGINEGDDRIGRSLMEAEEEVADAAKEEFLSSLLFANGVVDVDPTPFMGARVEDATSTSSLRGAMGPKRTL